VKATSSAWAGVVPLASTHHTSTELYRLSLHESFTQNTFVIRVCSAVCVDRIRGALSVLRVSVTQKLLTRKQKGVEKQNLCERSPGHSTVTGMPIF